MQCGASHHPDPTLRKDLNSAEMLVGNLTGSCKVQQKGMFQGEEWLVQVQ